MLEVDYLVETTNMSTNIFQAIKDGEKELVEEIVKKSTAVLESTDVQGWTPLHLAAAEGQVEIVGILVGLWLFQNYFT